MVVFEGNDYVKKVAVFDPFESLRLLYSRSNFNVVLCGGEGSLFPDLDEKSVVFSPPGIATYLSVPVEGGEADFSKVMYGKQVYFDRTVEFLRFDRRISGGIVKNSGPITLIVSGVVKLETYSYFNFGRLLGKGGEEISKALRMAKDRIEKMSGREGATGKIAQMVSPYLSNLDALSSLFSTNPSSGPLSPTFSYNKDLYDNFLYSFLRDLDDGIATVDGLVSQFLLSKTRHRLSSELEEVVSRPEVYESASRLASDHFSSLMKSAGGILVTFDYAVNHLYFKNDENECYLHFFDVHMDRYAYELYSEGKEGYRSIDIKPEGDNFLASKVFYSDFRNPSLIDDIRLLVLTLPVVIYINRNRPKFVALLFVLVPVFSSSYSKCEVLEITSYYKPLKSKIYLPVVKSQPEEAEGKNRVLSLDYEISFSSSVDKDKEVDYGKKRFSVEGYVEEGGKFTLEVDLHQSGPEEVREALLLRKLVPKEGPVSSLLDAYVRISLDQYLRSVGLCVPLSGDKKDFVYLPKEGLDEELLPEFVRAIRKLGIDYYDYSKGYTLLANMVSEGELSEAIKEGSFIAIHRGVSISARVETQGEGGSGPRRLFWSSKEKYVISGLEIYRNQNMTILLGGVDLRK